VTRTSESWEYPLGIKEKKDELGQDCKRKDGWICPSYFVSKRQGQGVDAADFGSNACNAHEGFGRSGKGRERLFPSSNQKIKKTFLFSFLNFSFFQKCDSDTRGLDLSVLFCECKAVRARSDLHRSWLMRHPRSETPKATGRRPSSDLKRVLCPCIRRG
jgi:hypothetical protein